ncbi:MAG TPA: glycoside hydrolase family 2 TIM barrel-domain containing protein [Candidatus Limnocylindrales bacterium]|nr:glycoside hydrolase family 2 TIM barrel-domain containing protein [Candidatus Limnocylindrales bacterium]
MSQATAAGAAPFLVALELCGVELGAPHLRTRTKRRIEMADVDVASLPSDSLRFVGWAPDAIEAVFPGLDPAATYELEATYVCERDVRRVQRMTSGEPVLHPPAELVRGSATVVRAPVPAEAIVDGVLPVRIERVEGPDVVMSELRLFSSAPVAPTITVAGDSRGALVGTVGGADGVGIAGATVEVDHGRRASTLTTDAAGVFRVPLREAVPLGQDASLTISTGSGATRAEIQVATREIARGLRELPPASERLDLGGAWGFHGGPYRGHDPAGHDPVTTRVPGHVIYDALVPEDGVATFRRGVGLPEAWADRAVFLRCDGAYGRAEVRINGTLAAVHGGGATSFDVDLSPFLRPGRNDLAITLTEFTPHAVLDDMSWYAHMSLLGIWRDVFLFAVPRLHLGQVAIDADWDDATRTGTLDLALDVINQDVGEARYDLAVAVRDRTGGVVREIRRSGTVGGRADARETVSSGPLAVEPWSAETPALYELEVTIGRPGDPGQSYRRRIGFRRVETRGNRLLVNGAPIRIRGVNRHDSRMLKGRALSADDMREDVVNLRRANVNVIRTSHYPPSPHLLEICDEVGMFVFEQPPVCFSGGFDDHHWTRTNEAAPLIPVLLEVTAETVARDDGRPSVIVWDLGNESRWGPGFDAQLALVREMDPHRPTIFSFDLNELGPENVLIPKPDAERPDIRSYHYPGWDRTWQEDLDWLGAYKEPTVLDEYAPVFAPCLRGPGEGYGLAIDPGIRDYWGAGYQPFMAAALQDEGVIGGLIWGGFGEVFAIPLDLTIGQGPWAHLPVTDYVRTHDHYPAEPGVFRRGDGDWGLFDAWNRPRPELWHVHGMYSPIEWGPESFAADGASSHLDLVLTNGFAHRSLAGLEVRVVGGRLGAPESLAAGPGETARLVIVRTPDAEAVRVELVHEEGWLVDGREWRWPGAGPIVQDRVRDRAIELALDLSVPGELSLSGDGVSWMRRWPELHVLDVDQPHVPVPSPRTDGRQIVLTGPGAARAPLLGHDWEGWISARVDGGTVIVEYEATYRGGRSFNAKEIGLTLHPAPDLRDLWWQRVGDWTVYPEDHVGRPAGYAPGRPGSNGALTPAPTWPQDATPAGSNDYRSTKRSILAAGATDGRRSLSILSDGTQHVRAELVDGSPALHVLDWYGGVRTVEGNHRIWSAYFGGGRPVVAGMRLQGRIVLAAGRLA